MAAGLTIVQSGAEKTAVMPPKVIVGGAKKHTVKVHVVQGGAKKLVWQASTTPWDFHASGISASADPTTQAFGYTATAGQLLYFAASGPMTQITPSGWTKIAPSAVALEHALFRKTAAGGETSITVDHNGARPMGWGFWAFPSGSTHHSSTTGRDSSDSITLSGLPGTAVTVLEVWARPVATTAGTLATVAWSGGVTEQFDNFLSGTGSVEGVVLSGAYALAYTSTSITPSGVGTNVTGSPLIGTDRYKIAWAVSPP